MWKTLLNAYSKLWVATNVFLNQNLLINDVPLKTLSHLLSKQGNCDIEHLLKPIKQTNQGVHLNIFSFYLEKKDK